MIATCTKFRTFTDEAGMREMYPGRALYRCRDCRKEICLQEDVQFVRNERGMTTEAYWQCPSCWQLEQDAARIAGDFKPWTTMSDEALDGIVAQTKADTEAGAEADAVLAAEEFDAQELEIHAAIDESIMRGFERLAEQIALDAAHDEEWNNRPCIRGY